MLIYAILKLHFYNLLAWISMGYITQALALATIPAGKCAFICSLTVVVVPLISSIFFDKPIKPLNLVAAAVALSGVAILEGLVDTSSLAHALPFANSGGVTAEVIITASVPVAKSAVVASSTAGVTNMSLIQKMASGVGVGKGDIIALGQPFGFGLAFMRIEHYVEKFQEEKNQILTLSAAQCVTVGILSLLWVLHDFHGVIPNMEYMVSLVFLLSFVFH
jgi:drug/metabolite transporter (DMT)-like permease